MKKKRSDFRRRLVWLLGGAVVVWLVLMVVAGDSGALALVRVRDRQQELMAEERRLEAANAKLEDEIERLKSDPATIGKVAREELMMASPDEVVILVPDPKTSAGQH